MRTQRTIGIIVVTCFVVGTALVVGLVTWLGVGPALGLVLVVVVAYLLALGPRQRRWGATDDEVRRTLPGDDLLRADAPSTTRAITIDAPPEEVFPWLLQIGFGRGGWYSYDWIDNDGLPSVERIEPDLRLAVGDRVEMMPGFGPVVRMIEPGRCMVSGGDTDSWCLLVESMVDGRTRLISRWKQDWPRTFATYAWIVIADPGAFIMERKMLLRIRELAERSVANAPR
ncbi:MAG: hypothetical protein ACXWGA_14860 [Actinomycetota bacterium]